MNKQRPLLVNPVSIGRLWLVPTGGKLLNSDCKITSSHRTSISQEMEDVGLLDFLGLTPMVSRQFVVPYG